MKCLIDKPFRKFYGLHAARLLLPLLLVAIPFPIGAQTMLSLEEAIDAALKNNHDIRISRLASDVDKANNTAGNAGMLPTLGLTGGVNASSVNNRQVTMADAVTDSKAQPFTMQAGVELSWKLFDGGKMFVTRQKLREVEARGALQFQETVQETLYGVVGAYYELIRLKQQLLAVQQTIRYNEDRLTIAETGFNAGALSKQDWLQAKIDLNEVKASEIDQQFAIKSAKRRLNQLMARSIDTPFETVDSIPNGFEPDRSELLDRLNASNAQLLFVQKQLEISKLAFKEAESRMLPQVQLNAGYSFSQTNGTTNGLRSNRNLGPEIGGTVTVPLYQAGEARRLKQVAELEARSAETDLERIRLELNVALQDVLNEYDNQKALIKMEEENSMLTREYLEISIKRLKLGQTNSLEVHLAQQSFLNANARLINYRYQLKMAETKLKQLISAL